MRVSATSFKARCLSMLDEVAESGAELIITKRGRPVARVSPVDQDASLQGSVRTLVGEDELLAPIGDEWGTESAPLR